MSDLHEHFVRSNAAGLTLALGGAGVMLSRDGSVPWVLVVCVLAFLAGIITWAVHKTPVRYWFLKNSIYDPALGKTIGKRRDPIPTILRSLEGVSLIAGIIFGILFLVGVAR